MSATFAGKNPGFLGDWERAAVQCCAKDVPLSLIAVSFDPPEMPDCNARSRDRLLGTLERRFRALLPHHYAHRIEDTLGIVFPETHEGTALELAERIIFESGACVGIATIAHWGDPIEDLREAFGASLTALRAAARRGSGSIVAYTDELERTERREAILARAIRRAAANDQLRLLYQPIVEIETQRIVAVESLVRWEHPQLQTVMPSEFTPLAARLECSLEIDRWVLQQALRDFAAMRKSARDLMLHVNICPATLNKAGEGAGALEQIRKSGVPAECVILEITEDPGERSAALFANVQTLRDNGVKIALDDLGRGSNSLAFLAELPCDIVKVERALVPFDERDERKAVVFASVMSACEHLGVRMIVEMVETHGQHQFLVRKGVTHAQGFHYARPLTAEALTRSLHF